MTVTTPTRSTYLTPEQVCEIIPGMSKGNLAQMRFKSTGPRYLKPSPKVVIYREDDVIEWLESTARTGTAEGA